MRKIGILYGMENTFPSAVVERINQQNIPDVSAEHIRVGGVKITEASGYSVIIDRVSQDIDFYRAYLKNAALNGTVVLNDPFRWSAHDRFFHYALARQIGLNVPNTVVIPQKSHPPGTTVQSMRNLAFPLDWDELFEFVQFPAFFKPLGRATRLSVSRVKSSEEFFAAYDNSGPVCMLLQAAIPYQTNYRCYVIGQEHVRVLRYDANQPVHLRYTEDKSTPSEVCDKLAKDSLTFCKHLGYDINAVDFGVHDGIPYVLDSFNLSPDADVHSIGPDNFEWVVENVARLAIQKAAAHQG